MSLLATACVDQTHVTVCKLSRLARARTLGKLLLFVLLLLLHLQQLSNRL